MKRSPSQRAQGEWLHDLWALKGRTVQITPITKRPPMIEPGRQSWKRNQARGAKIFYLDATDRTTGHVQLDISFGWGGRDLRGIRGF